MAKFKLHLKTENGLEEIEFVGTQNYHSVYIDWESVSNVSYDDDTVFWDTNIIFKDENDEEIQRKPVTIQLPIIAGTGLKFEPNRNQDRLLVYNTVQGGLTQAQQSVTYAQLVELRDNATLIAGMKYRITDYQTTTVQYDTRSVGHPFDIIVTAISNDTLSENATVDYHRTGGSAFDPTVFADGDGNLVDGAIVAHYYISEDYAGPSEEGPVADYKADDVFIAYDYLENGDGDIVPVIFKTDNNGRFDNPDEYGYPDFEDTFYYTGTMEVDGVVYDKWRKITRKDDSDLTWDSEGKVWTLTNRVIVGTEIDPYFANAKLPSWQIKYCLDNDTSRFVWADEENGKGVIYYMKDEYNNECPYDFKNIQFIRKLDDDGNLDLENGTGTWCYTFGGNQWDRSIPQGEMKVFNHNSICPHYTGCDMAFALPKNVFLGNSECMTKNNRLAWSCSDNTFGTECQNNTLGFNSGNNIFGNYCQNNILGNECRDNKFGNGCQVMTLKLNCHKNTFPNDCYCVKFGNNVHSINLTSDTGGTLKYITIANGVFGDWDEPKVISVVADADYEQIFRKSGVQEILVD